MSNEQSYKAIILKKQPYREADEIITFYTKENGKVRALAKSIKSPKSKLQQRLQTLFLVDVRLTLGKMNKIIGAETINVYHRLRENLPAMKMAFYACELCMKITADEQMNEPLFNLLQEFLEFLDAGGSQESLNLGLAKFKIENLEVSGFGIQSHPSELFKKIKATNFKELASLESEKGIDSLNDSLSLIIEQELERKLKSENFLKA